MNTIRRITYVVNVFPKLSETFIATEIAELIRRGIKVQILSRRRPSDIIRHQVVTDNGLDKLVLYEQEHFSHHVRIFKPQIIHAHFATRATETARQLAHNARIPFTFTAHRYDIYDRPPEDFSARCDEASAVITVSEANADHMVDRLGARRDNLFVIPCGIDTRLFKPNELQVNNDPLIVCVARLHIVKNLPVLLLACGLLRDRGVRFHCVVIGDGDERERLDDVRRFLGLEAQVSLVGSANQDQVSNWWQKATVGVLTSRSEGMPVSFMEALACGVPVVGPRVGGIPEMITHGVDGYVVQPDSPQAVADALQKIISDRNLAERMGMAARETALRRFSIDAQVDSLIGVWDAVLTRRDAL